ncbi:MAG: EthD family reductase [Pseudohongiellaceae bacterium]|nr:EthD family reductase [Pseudohongiellaceae bacterium]
MIRVNIMYPYSESAHFDFDYYLDKHMPLAVKLLSAHEGYKGVAVEKGLAGVEPGSTPQFFALCHFSFTSAEAFLEAFMPNAETLQGDIPNYTNSQAVIQFSEVLM